MSVLWHTARARGAWALLLCFALGVSGACSRSSTAGPADVKVASSAASADAATAVDGATVENEAAREKLLASLQTEENRPEAKAIDGRRPFVSRCSNLRLELKREVDPSTGSQSLSVSIRNNGKLPVSLTSPGDGSETRRRNPSFEWRVTGTKDNRSGFCGNTNSLSEQDLLTVAPGASAPLAWVNEPGLEKSGTYFLSAVYRNDPEGPLVAGVTRQAAPAEQHTGVEGHNPFFSSQSTDWQMRSA
jgi:hypothetical protein